MEKNLFIYIDWLPVVHVASRFSEKMSQKEVVSEKKKKKKKRKKEWRKKQWHPDGVIS